MSEEKQNPHPEQNITEAPEQGIPSVTGKSKSKSKKGGMALLFFALVGAIAIAAVYSFNTGTDDVDDTAQTTAQNAGLTSSKSLTLPPLPPEEPKPETVVEIKAEPDIDIADKPPQAAVPAPLPVTQGAVDADGNPIPTLEELKFAAPMMGEINRSSAASAGRSRSNDAVMVNSGSQSAEAQALSNRYEGAQTPAKSASIIKNRSLLLGKGTVIECILESRVDTTVPGMTSCVIPRDIYSADGRVLLVEKGTKAVGEYQGSVANGLARIFMLWTELRTPKGVVIALNSPAADQLGAAGMGGYVDFHWWTRFGNALLFSLISDGFQYAINTADSHNNNGDVTYENTEDGMDEIIREAMRQSGDIPPTLIKNQGERVSIFVARDLNFESVYGLKAYGNY